MLSRFIRSYLALNLPQGLTISLEVVENGSACGVKELVGGASTPGHPVHYHHQPRLGIPCARNCSIRAALARQGTHIAFVDDDERFDPEWLVTIWAYLKQQNDNTVVQGAVYSVLPTSAPTYLANFFQREIKITGATLHVCRTNNVILPVSILTQHNLWFDESFPLAGGTDSKLFRQAHALGVKIKSCAEAIIYEDVPEPRASIKWLSQRNFRIGITMGELASQAPGKHRLTHFFQQGYRAIIYLLKYLLNTLFLKAREKRIRYWFKSCKTMGSGLGALGMRVDSYKSIQGD